MDQIMEATNINIWKMPVLNTHTGGNDKNKLCWPNVLGFCTRERCPFIHEKGRDLPDAFVEDACLKLKSGVNWVVDTQIALRNGPFGGVQGGPGR